jgi:2-succinyl-6-hydroxy-2,4-cyclohexadiene-1-carboxylate synthase
MPLLTANALAYHVEIDESRNAGTPSLLLLHGFTGSVRNWDALVPALSENFRVIRVDLPGHGRTAHSDDPSRYDMSSVAADLVALLKALGASPAVVCGYSMGARLGLCLAAWHPDAVSALCLESGSPGLATDAERAERRAADDALAARIVSAGVSEFAREWEALPIWRTQSDALKLSQRAGRLANRAEGLARSLRGMGTGAQPSVWEALPALTMPVRCVVGECDSKFVAIAAAMRERNPTLDVTVVPGIGHAVHLEAPTVWIDWLRRRFRR